jgi:hypothetical protein
MSSESGNTLANFFVCLELQGDETVFFGGHEIQGRLKYEILLRRRNINFIYT